MKKMCPRCRVRSMAQAGAIRAGPRKGYRRVYVCGKCGYRCIR